MFRVRRLPVQPSLRSLLIVPLLMLLASLSSSAVSPPTAVDGVSTVGTANNHVPAALWPRMNTDLAADDPRFAPVVRPGAADTLQVTNDSQRMDVTFTPDGVAITRRQGKMWRMGLVGIGDGTTSTPVSDAAPTLEEGRILYHRGTLTEWYLNGPLGIEQGFTLVAPPAASTSGIVTLDLHVADAIPSVMRDGVRLTLMDAETYQYEGLTVVDARGVSLPATLTVSGATLRIITTTTGAAWPVVVDPFIETTSLTATTPAAMDNLGFSVAVDAAGDVVVAGAQHKKVGTVLSGVAFVWHRSGAVSTTTLVEPSPAAGDQFGHSVAITADGSKVVIGAPSASLAGQPAHTGLAFVFSGSNYATEVTLIASGTGTNAPATGDGFGSGVAINADGTVVAVGAPFKTITDSLNQQVSGAGEVYLFEGLGYAMVSAVIPGNGASDASGAFGTSIALDTLGDILVVGEPTYALSVGGTEGGVWVEDFTHSTAKFLTASDHNVPDMFGSGVAVSGDGHTVVVGAPDKTGSFANQGAAYIYTGTNYGTEKKLILSGGAASDYFGYSVATNHDGSIVVIGTFNANKVFVYDGAPYVLAQTVTSTAPNGTHFGDSVGLSADGSTLAGGAPSEAVGAVSQAGKVHVFTLQVPVNQPTAHPTATVKNGVGPKPPSHPTASPKSPSPNAQPTRH